MGIAEELDRLPTPPLSPAERLREALEMYEEGIELQRQNLRRRHPHSSEREIDALLEAWLIDRESA